MLFKRRPTLTVLVIILLVLATGFGVLLQKTDFFGSADTDYSVPLASSKEKELPPIEGELLIKFKSEAPKEKKDKFYEKHGARVKSDLEQLGVQLISLETKNNPEEKAKTIREVDTDIIEYVEPNYQYRLAGIPNDHYYSTNQANWYNYIGGPTGWDVAQGDNIIIAIIDTGVDLTHPDLKDKIVSGYDYYNGDVDPTDDNGHGTATAGIAGAVTHNNQGIAGASWNAKIMPLKVCSSSGSCPYSSMAQALIYAADHGAQVASISIAGGSSSTTTQSAIDYAAGKGLVTVAAAGNNSNSPYVFYPGACNNVISVGGVYQSGSTYLRGGSNYGSALDVMSLISGAWTTSRGGGYGSFGGTSAATPYVAGLAALVKSIKPTLTAQEVTNYITQYTMDMQPVGWDSYTGWGIINFQKTLEAVASNVPAPIPTKGYVAGRVIEYGTGTILSNALIEAKQSGVTKGSTKTLSNGLYSLELVPGTYDIVATATDHKIQTISGKLVNQGSTVAQDFTLESTLITSSPLASGWHLISIPGKYTDPSPTAILRNFNLDSRLYKYLSANQSQDVYDSFNLEAFGNIASAEGYWFNVDTVDNGKRISFTGELEESTTKTVPLSVPTTGGWTIIGNPFNHKISIDNLTFYERKTKKFSFSQAVTNGWVDPTLYYWDAATNSLKTAGSVDSSPDSTEILPWYGYWLQLKRGGLTLEIRP